MNYHINLYINGAIYLSFDLQTIRLNRKLISRQILVKSEKVKCSLYSETCRCIYENTVYFIAFKANINIIKIIHKFNVGALNLHDMQLLAIMQ